MCIYIYSDIDKDINDIYIYMYIIDMRNYFAEVEQVLRRSKALRLQKLVAPMHDAKKGTSKSKNHPIGHLHQL